MDPLDFLNLAGDWASGSSEGEWRTSTSRAYYAAFHVARNLLRQAGFQVPMGDQCHNYVYVRLNNCGDGTIEAVGRAIHDLRRLRNRADYDLDVPFDEQIAINTYHCSLDITRPLAALAGNAPLLAQVVRAIVAYETAAFGSSTFHGP